MLSTRGETPVLSLVAEDGQPDLLKVVAALGIPADSRADWTAGNNMAIRMPMMVITTSSSTYVNAKRLRLLTAGSSTSVRAC